MILTSMEVNVCINDKTSMLGLSGQDDPLPLFLLRPSVSLKEYIPELVQKRMSNLKIKGHSLDTQGWQLFSLDTPDRHWLRLP